VDAIARCGTTDAIALAAIEELGECLRGARKAETRADIRSAMLHRAVADGALLPGAGQRLVKARVLSARQAKALEGMPTEVPRLIALHGQPNARITRAACTLQDDAAGRVELDCDLTGECFRPCGRRYYVVKIRVEDAGLKLASLTEDARDNGSCGCCK
jgi:hypothetical protein